jgi:hypothetical protein
MDPRLRAAVDESVCWYDDLFALHGIGCGITDGLWVGHGPPPPVHSAAKTVEPSVLAERAMAAVAAYEHCTVADSFGDLDLGNEPDLLFEAQWLHHPGCDAGPVPPGWSTVRTSEALAAWTHRHDTSDVLLPGLLERSTFRVLARRTEAGLVAGVVTHLCAGVVSISNVWAAEDHGLDWRELIGLAGAIWPGRALVGYERDEELDRAVEAGFSAVGPQLVWVR